MPNYIVKDGRIYEKKSQSTESTAQNTSSGGISGGNTAGIYQVKDGRIYAKKSEFANRSVGNNSNRTATTSLGTDSEIRQRAISKLLNSKSAEERKYLDDTAMNMRMAGASEDDIYKKVYGYDDKTLTEIAKETRAKEKEINKKPTYEEQYGDITANADYEQNKDYRSTKHGDGTRDALTGYMFDNGYDDIEHDIINKDGLARLNYNANKGDNYLANENTYLDYLEQDEIDKYNYLYNTKGKDEARKYVDSLKTTLNQRLKQSEEEYWKEQTDKEGAEGVANRVGLWALGRVATLGKPLEYLNQLGDVFANGGDIDKFDPKNSRLSTMNNAINESIGQKWDQAAKKFIQQGYSGAYANDLRANGYSEDEIQQMMSNIDENFGNGAGNFAYQTITSMADFLTTALVTGGFNATLSDAEREIAENLSLAIMGSGAAADSTLEALSEGKDSQRAFVIGTIAGIAEILTEKVSIETLLDKTLMVQDSGKYILKNFLAEGSEEVGSDVINLVADVLINADENKIRTRVEELMSEGKTENEAFGIAVGEQAMEMGMDFLGGAISGGFMGMSSVGLNNFKMGMDINDIDTARATATELIENPSGEKSTQMAQAILDKVNNGQKPSIMEMGRLVNQLTMDLETNEKKAEIKQKKESKLEKQPSRLEELATEKIQTENAKENAQATNTMAETENAVENENTEPQSNVDELTRNAAVLEYFTSAMSDDAREVVKGIVNVNSNVENVVQESQAYYIAGMMGTPINEVTSFNDSELNSQQKKALYDEGLKAKIKGESVYNETIKQPIRKGELAILQSIKRNDGTNLEVRLSEVEESTGKQTAMPKDRATASIEGGRYVSTEELGLEGGLKDKGVMIIPENQYTKTMRKANKEIESIGAKAVFVSGLMEIKEGKCRGAVYTDTNGDITIYVQADHPAFDSLQIAKHEICHTKIRKGEIDLKQSLNAIEEKLGGKEKFNQYLMAYGMSYNMFEEGHILTDKEIENILIEMICDAYGNMNSFENISFGLAAEFSPVMDIVKENTQSKTNQANAPPTGEEMAFDMASIFLDENIPFNFSKEAQKKLSKQIEKGARNLFNGRQLYTDSKLEKAKSEINYSIEMNDSLMTGAKKVFSDNELQIKYEKGMKSMLKDVAKLREYLAKTLLTEEYSKNLPKDIAGQTIKSNASYSKSIENALVCIRSLANQYYIDRVSELVGRPLTIAEQLYAQSELNNASGINEQECQYCYIAMDRAYYRQMLKKYYDDYNTFYDLVQKDKAAYKKSLKWKFDDTLTTAKDRKAAAKKTNPLYSKYLDGRDSTINMWNRYQRYVQDALDNNRVLDPKDLATDQRMEDAKNRDELTRWYMEDAYRYSESAAQAVAKSRDVKVGGETYRLDYVAYNGSILKLSSDAIKHLNDEYGLRMYSYSDYVPHFILENIQMVTDASVMGLKMLSYTKDVNFARIFAETNMNINISVKGYSDGNGGYIQDGMQGANWEEAKAVRNDFDNVGIVYVATSDAEVKWAIAQDWVDVVIPWHTVRYSGAEYTDAFNYENFKQTQADKKEKNWKATNESYKAKNNGEELHKSIPPTAHKNDITLYEQELKKNHLKPRFEKYYKEFRDKYDATGKNMYMKLVNETRKPYDETKPVVPKFNRELVIAEMEKVKEFEYGVPKEYKTEANRNEVLDDSIGNTANNISNGNIKINPKQNLSKEIDSEGNKLSKQVQEYFSESQARDEEGRLKEYYHGSRMAGFTTFNAMRSDDKRSLFFTDSRSVAKSYYGGPETDFIPDKKYSFSELSQMIDSFSMGDEILSKTADGYALTDVFEEEIASFKTLNEARDYFFDKIVPYDNDLEGTYNVYLNATNPLRVDAKEERWNSIPPRYYANEYNELSIVHNGDVYEVDYADENFDYYHEILSKEEFDDKFGFQDYIYRDGGNEEYFERLYTDINGTVIPTTTRDYAAYAQASGYDSVIFDNIADTGIYTGNEYETSQVVVVFNSDQVKSVENKNPTSKPDIRYSKEMDADATERLVNIVSFFSGGGTVDGKIKENLSEFIKQVAVVEKNPEISKAYALNEKGEVIGLGESVDVRDFLSRYKFEKGTVNAFHASPSCCNFSGLKMDGENEIDKLTAQATSDFIREVQPKVFTLENVAQYMNSESLRYITEALADMGYRFRIGVYNASQFGAAANRRRMLLVATNNGVLTSVTPFLTEQQSWYSKVGDMVESLPDIELAESIRNALKRQGVNPDNPGQYLFIDGKIQFKKARFATQDKPAPTFVASSSQYRILTPDGRCKNVSPRMVARLMGLSDSFNLPDNRALAFRILGNGVSGELTASIITPMITQNILSDSLIDKSNQAINDAYIEAVNGGDIQTATDLFNLYVGNMAGANITPFVTAHSDYYEGNVREIAHAMKSGNNKIINQVASEMSEFVPENAVLIPIPSRTGRAKDTLKLARAIGRMTNTPVVDALRGVERISQYEAKKNGKALTSEEIRMHQAKAIPEDRIPIFIDNVIATGNTMASAIRAVGRGVGLTYAYSQVESNVMLKTAEPITYDDNGNVIPLSERFNADNKNINYSKEPTGFQELKAENENLKKELSSLANEIDKWKGELRISKPLRVREVDANRVAKNLIKTYSSTANRTDISGMLEILGDYVLNNNADEDYSDNIQAMAHNIASELVNTASVLRDDGFGEVYDYLKKYYKDGSGITLSAKDKADIPDWNDFRKQNFGKIKLTNNGLPVDVAYGELMGLFPELFPEEITHPADQLMKMVEVYDDIAPQYENPYKNYAFEMADIIDSVAKDVIEQSTNGQLKATKSTFADKQEAKLKKANDDKIKVIEKYQSKLDALKDKRNNDIAKLKESYKKANDKRVLNKKTSELRNRIMRHCKQLNNKLLHPTDKQHIPEAYKSAVATMLKSINLESNFRIINGKRVNVADIPFEESGMPTNRTEAFSNLRKQYEILVNTGSVPLDESLLGTDGWLQEIIEWGDTPIGNLDAEKLGVIINVIKAVESSIDRANKLFNAGKWQLVSDYANALYDENMSKKQKAEWRYNSVNKLFLDMLTPEAYFYRLGETGQNLYRMMRESQDDFIRIIADAVEFNNKNLAGMNSNKLENIKVNVKLGGQELELTTAQLMELYVLSNRKQALNHILKGGIIIKEINTKKLKSERMIKPVQDITLEDLTEAFKKLTPEQIVWANTMQSYLSNDMAALGNKASMEVYNYKKFNEENYWRIRVYDLDRNQEIGADTKGVTSVAGKGMAKTPNPDANNTVILGGIFNSYTKQIFEMAEYSAWLKTMEDINRIRNYKLIDEYNNKKLGKVSQAIQNVHGTQGTDYLQKLLTDIANGVHSEQAYFGGMFGNYKAAAVGMNLRVAVQQPTAILRAMDMIAPKYLSAGLINPMKGWKKAVKYSPIAQWKDWGYFDINTGKQMKDVLLENTSKMAKAKEIAMKPASVADSFAWGQLWNAIELETKDKYPDIHPNSTEFHEICAERFARIIDHSQVVDGVLQRSQIMRSESFYSKMITAFMGEPTKQYNQFMNAIYDINNSKDTTKAKKQAVRVMFSMAAAGVLNAVVQSLVDAMRHSDRDKDYWSQWLEEFTGFTGDEKTFGEWFKSFLSGNVEDVANPTSYLPLVKDIMSIIKGYDVDRMDVSMISDVVTAARNFTKVLTGQGKETIGYSLINMSTAIAKMFGVPADNVKKDILSIVNTIINNFGNIELQYNRDKLFYDVKAEKTNADGTKSKVNYSRYVDILHDAYTTDKSSYYNIYNDLMNNDYESDKITSTMNSKLVKDNNLESVKELNERYITPNKEKKYQSTLKAITSSTAYKKLSTEKQQSARSTVYTYANESSDTLKNTLAKANKNGITDTQYLLYTLARQVVDKPNKNGKLGTYTEAEKKEAASMAGIAYEKIKAMEKSE